MAITNVSVWMVVSEKNISASPTNYRSWAKTMAACPSLYGGNWKFGTQNDLTSSNWSDKGTQYAVSPWTAVAWTEAEITGLKSGIQFWTITFSQPAWRAQCSEIYMYVSRDDGTGTTVYRSIGTYYAYSYSTVGSGNIMGDQSNSTYIYTTNWLGGDAGMHLSNMIVTATQQVRPISPLMRVTGIRHVYRPGLFRMIASLGDVGGDITLAEHMVRKELETVAEPKPTAPVIDLKKPSGIIEEGIPYKPGFWKGATQVPEWEHLPPIIQPPDTRPEAVQSEGIRWLVSQIGRFFTSLFGRGK